MEYHSTLKRNAFLRHATMWMNTENVLNETNGSQKTTQCVIPYTNTQNRQIPRTDSGLAVARGYGKWGMGINSKWCDITSRSTENVLKIDSGGSQPHE